MLKTFSYSVFSLVLLWMFSSCSSVFPIKKQVTTAVHRYEIHVATNSMHEAGFIEATVADETGTDEMAAAAETNYMKYTNPSMEVLTLKQRVSQKKAMSPAAAQASIGKVNKVKQIIAHTDAFNQAKSVYSPKTKAEEGRKVDGFALASMILGIGGIFFILLPVTNIIFLALASAVLAIVFGLIGLKRIRQNPETLKGRGFGLTGLISGIVFLALILIIIIAVIASLNR